MCRVAKFEFEDVTLSDPALIPETCTTLTGLDCRTVKILLNDVRGVDNSKPALKFRYKLFYQG